MRSPLVRSVWVGSMAAVAGSTSWTYGPSRRRPSVHVRDDSEDPPFSTFPFPRVGLAFDRKASKNRELVCPSTLDFMHAKQASSTSSIRTNMKFIIPGPCPQHTFRHPLKRIRLRGREKLVNGLIFHRIGGNRKLGRIRRTQAIEFPTNIAVSTSP